MGSRTKGSGRGSGGGPGQRGERAAPLAPDLIVAATPPAAARRAVTGLLLRFISCGLLALSFGIAWRLTLAPSRIGPGSAFAGIFALLLGFIAGGMLWYFRDARRRSASPEKVSDERLVFSFVVFAAVPFAVLLLVGLVWLIAFLIGVS
jgi:hypothetical protein